MTAVDIIDRLAYVDTHLKEEEQYWLDKLAGIPPKTRFPADPDNGEGEKAAFGTIQFEIQGEQFTRILKLCNQSEPKLHMVFITGIVIMLNKYTGTRDILLGTPIYRQHHQSDFMNTLLVLRNQLKEGITFKESLLLVRHTLIQAEAAQNYPIELIIQKLGIPYGKGEEFPLFDVAVILENLQDKQYMEQIQCNIQFLFQKTGDRILGTIQYNTNLYQSIAMGRIAGELKLLLRNALNNVEKRIEDLDILTSAEKNQLIFQFNQTHKEENEPVSLMDLIQDQVEKTPKNTSLVMGDKQITYHELDIHTDQLANQLRTQGLKPGRIAAVISKPTSEAILEIVAILKTGSAFLPLDPQYPKQRKQYIIRDSGVQRLYLDLESNTRQPKEPTQVMVQKMQKGDRHLAYIIYTSGTTGTPKGVMVEHRGIVNYIRWAIRNYGKGQEKSLNFPLYTSLAFDLTLTSIFVPLVSGNTICVYGGGNGNVAGENLLETIIHDNRVHIIKCTPTHLKLIRDLKVSKGSTQLHSIVVGGESLDPSLALEIYHNFCGLVQIYNEYGPTETVVGSTIYQFQAGRNPWSSVPIGKPIHNTQVYLLDKHTHLVPIGAIGEIYIGGVGVTRGYLGKPGITSERYIQNPYIEGQRLYRTGDLGRRQPDGNILYQGRVDRQVKIRGYRIELQEIESHLQKHNEIKDVVVLDRKDTTGGENYLCAYIQQIPRGKSTENLRQENLIEYLSHKLPSYMVPQVYVCLPKFPHTPNGKVDLKALPEPQLIGNSHLTPLKGKVEEKLAQVWTEILGVPLDHIGRESDFFSMGGHSLKATLLVSKIHQAFHVKITLTEVFNLSRLQDMAQKIDETDQERFFSIKSTEKREYYELTHSQKRIWILSQNEKASLTFHITAAFIIKGKLDTQAFIKAYATIIHRHESLRTVFFTHYGEPFQKIITFPIPGSTVRHIEAEDSEVLAGKGKESLEGKARHMAELEQEIPFNLIEGPLIRSTLIPIDPRKHVILITMHHIISDGLSMEVFFQELITLYNDIGEGKRSSLSPLRIQYRDFMAWQNRTDESIIQDKNRDYWKEELKGRLPQLALPQKTPRPEITTYNGTVHSIQMEEALIAELRELGEQEGTTLFMTCLTALNILFYKYTGQTDIIIGTPVAGRQHADLDGQIGFYLNTLTLRMRFKPDETSIQLLKKVKAKTLQVYQHQGYPFEQLVSDLEIKRDPGRHPIFDVVIDMMNDMSTKEMNLKSQLTLEPFMPTPNKSKFDLTLYILERKKRVTLNFEYNTDIFEETFIKGLATRYQTLLQIMVMEPGKRMSEIELVGEVRLPGFPPSRQRETATERHKPATCHQERLWFIHQFEKGKVYPHSPVYHNIPVLAKIKGKLNIPRLEKSIRAVVQKHEILRTFIVTEEERPLQVIGESGGFVLTQKELIPCDENGIQEQKLLETVIKESNQPFEIAKDRLMRATLIHTGEQAYLLTITLHHIIADPYTLDLILREIFTFYQGEEKKGSDTPVTQFSRFMEWESELKENHLDPLLFYWREKLRGKIQPLELPTDFPRDPVHVFQGKTQTFQIPERLGIKIEAFCLTEKVEQFDFFLSIFKQLLKVYSGLKEIVVGTLSDHRRKTGMQRIAGPIDNLLVLRDEIRDTETFREILSKVSHTVTEAKTYGAIPFDKLVQEIHPQVDMSRTALFDILYRYQEGDAPLPQIPGISLKVLGTNTGWGKYDLNLGVYKKDWHAFSGHLTYNALLFKETFMKRFSDHYQKLLENLLENPDVPHTGIPFLSEAEKHNLVYKWNQTSSPYPDHTIPEEFRKQEQCYPHHISLSYQNRQLTYQVLGEKSWAIAESLRQEYKVEDHSIVALYIRPSEEMIASLLGILEAGATYLPIDTHSPGERVAYILKDSQAEQLIIEEEDNPEFLEDNIEPIPLPVLTTKRITGKIPKKQSNRNHSQDPAYIIYTSGTTGRPKGCIITHLNLVRLVCVEKIPLEYNEKDTWILFHSYCFDFSVWEMYGSLLKGGKLILPDREEVKNTPLFLKEMKKNKVTILNQTPGAFYNLVQEEIREKHKTLHYHLRYVIFGGERLEPGQLKPWKEKYPLEQIRLVNMYGITETTIHVTSYYLNEADINSSYSRSIIGEPLPETTIYILDPWKKLNPIGVIGEIYVGGKGVSRGYLNNISLTDNRFLENPYIPGEILYRTGDLGQRKEDGTIEYAGRIDNQVKIRGYRIELNEIQVQILTYPGIKEAVVLAKETDEPPSDTRLIAYLVSDQPLPVNDIKQYLAKKIPDYMIPAFLLQVPEIPLTPHGKTDIQALEEYGLQISQKAEYVAPRDETEKIIAQAWKEVLNLEEVPLGIHDNFFDFGGNSLILMKLLAKLKEHFGDQIEVVDLFQYPTISTLSQYLGQKKNQDTLSDQQVEESMEMMKDSIDFFLGEENE